VCLLISASANAHTNYSEVLFRKKCHCYHQGWQKNHTLTLINSTDRNRAMFSSSSWNTTSRTTTVHKHHLWCYLYGSNIYQMCMPLSFLSLLMLTAALKMSLTVILIIGTEFEILVLWQPYINCSCILRLLNYWFLFFFVAKNVINGEKYRLQFSKAKCCRLALSHKQLNLTSYTVRNTRFLRTKKTA